MPYLTIAAIYFIIWWTVLFVVLPLGYRSQQEDGDVMLGTVESAPTSFHAVRVLVLTTLLAAILHAGYYYVVSGYFGFSIGHLPNIVPEFG